MTKDRGPIVDQLGAHPLFEGLSDKDLDTVAELVQPLQLRAGSTVMLERYHGEQLLVIVSGSVEVTRDGEHVATVEAGSFVGEMGMLRGADRSASVRAASDVKMLTVDRSSFDDLIERFPVIRGRLEDEMEARDDGA
jgi:CRP-like cAMP-binding protein